MSANPDLDAAYQGAALYDGRTLRAYDLVVHGLSNHLAWRCPTRTLRALYAEHVSSRHLDVGVGSGYFLDRCRFPVAEPRLSLLDLNAQALSYAARRVQRYRPLTHVGSVLTAGRLTEAPFDSIALMYLLHCVPGNLTTKAAAFANLGPQLSDSGVLFGATILGSGVEHSLPARALMKLYNARQIFCNAEDRKADLEQALAQNFRDFSVSVRGSVALFVARGYSGRRDA
jgi:hypothetical protein